MSVAPEQQAGPLEEEFDLPTLVGRLEELALAASRQILDVLAQGFECEFKPDKSPVTDADRRAEAVVLDGLRASYPEIHCVAEEEMARGGCSPDTTRAFFLVDALDGTREFVGGYPDFTVNIALIREGEPVAGVVLAPARRILYSGAAGRAEKVELDEGLREVQRSRIAVRGCIEPVAIVASRSHPTQETTDYIARFGAAEILSIGSSLKFCLLAEGAADLYPRFGRTMEWDTAAGDAVLRAAGGRTRRLDGSPLLYGKRSDDPGEDFANPWFISEGGGCVDWELKAQEPPGPAPVAHLRSGN